ncbi:ubx domain-containing protein 4-like [Plakobranchus ocellatus]|uniref:UBX domain-containing protein 4 n=1 Tax=Plakobranchus ocellatus TaxID=259542 RepID=A0AAV4CH15_9GAST|nr:ubx domain-containing protein 4-like [Plakobranchus ocellatus]
MKWFQGDIPSAIKTAKTNKSVFIVFIAGDCDKTREMENNLHSEEVTRLCEQNKAVAVKLAGGSNDCKFFSQIYPVVVIPSIFFIGDNGVPLEVIGECKSAEEFREKVKKTLEIQKSTSATAAEAASSIESAGASAQAEQKSSDAASPITNAAEEVDETGSGDDNSNTQGKQSLEERVDRAKELLEQKRQEKMRKEAEEARQKEIERRNIGQGVQKLREQQKEMQLLEAKRELQKEKENDRLARQKVKEEIERDRAEKALKFNKQKNEQAQAREEENRRKLAEQQAALAEEQARRSDIARIQFRMADGSFLTQQFPATETFRTIEEFIIQHLGSEVSLSTSFPRRMFTAADRDKTLQELQLAPSAAILVIPRGQSGSEIRSSRDAGLVANITNLVLSPFFFVWNILCSLLGFSGSSPPSPQEQTSSGGSAATSSDRNRSGLQKGPATSNSRQEGAIRRFRNTQDDDDEDERNTWNGNSTQQM